MNDCTKCTNQCEEAGFWLTSLEMARDGLDKLGHLIDGLDLNPAEMADWSQAFEILLACRSTIVRELIRLAENCRSAEDPNL